MGGPESDGRHCIPPHTTLSPNLSLSLSLCLPQPSPAQHSTAQPRSARKHLEDASRLEVSRQLRGHICNVAVHENEYTLAQRTVLQVNKQTEARRKHDGSRHTDRQKDRQIDRQGCRQADRQSETADRQVDRQRDRQGRQTDRWVSKQTNKQANKQTNKQTRTKKYSDKLSQSVRSGRLEFAAKTRSGLHTH